MLKRFLLHFIFLYFSQILSHDFLNEVMDFPVDELRAALNDQPGLEINKLMDDRLRSKLAGLGDIDKIKAFSDHGMNIFEWYEIRCRFNDLPSGMSKNRIFQRLVDLRWRLKKQGEEIELNEMMENSDEIVISLIVTFVFELLFRYPYSFKAVKQQLIKDKEAKNLMFGGFKIIFKGKNIFDINTEGNKCYFAAGHCFYPNILARLTSYIYSLDVSRQ